MISGLGAPLLARCPNSASGVMAKEQSEMFREVVIAMKAVLLTGHGGLEKLEYREDVPTPEPAQGEVLIAVDAAGINNTDIWTREGAYGTEDDPAAASGWRRGNPMRFPRIQGADIVGRIAGLGGGVDASRVGERGIVDKPPSKGGGKGLF